ncbi:hypothetical protein cypCar_00004100 [Cyprinus carpio]|nr:hypothetical protein cypCar_00004100 [Cyprinus carpio]
MSEEDRLTLLDEDWSDSPVKTLSRAGFIVLSVFLGFIMTFGFFNNFIVLVLFCKFKTLRTPVNVLLLNISVSDMLVCIFGTTLSFASSVRGRWLLGRRGCMWYGFINSCFAVLCWERRLEREHARHFNIGRCQCEKPPFSQREISKKWVKDIMMLKAIDIEEHHSFEIYNSNQLWSFLIWRVIILGLPS